jgi:hypothetical protein
MPVVPTDLHSSFPQSSGSIWRVLCLERWSKHLQGRGHTYGPVFIVIIRGMSITGADGSQVTER